MKKAMLHIERARRAAAKRSFGAMVHFQVGQKVHCTPAMENALLADMKADGYSLDDKRNEIKDNDIPDLLSRYHNLKDEANRARTDKSFLVPFDEIKGNDWDLSINRYKEIVYEEIEYAAPADIIKDIEVLDKERNQALEALKEMLG